MKKLLTIFLSIISLTLMAQVPQGVGYQGVATDANGIELVNQAISIRASVLSGSATGTIEWEETHATSTDTFGLFTLTIGQGTNTTNGLQTSFADISWGTNTHFLKIEMDVTGGSNYSFMGTNQMMSVPYALYAENANINYDSISNLLSNDSTFITTVGGGMGGGGCDFIFPDGLDGEVINYSFTNEGDFTVPAGKTLYMMKAQSWNGGVTTPVTTYITSYPNHSNLIFKEGTVLIANNAGDPSFMGLLVDNSNSQVTPILHSLYFQGDFVVPQGKILYMYLSDWWDGDITVNGGSIFKVGYPGENGLIFKTGVVIKPTPNNTNQNSSFNGYLVDENYFAGCGGGGSSSTSSLDSTTIANMIANSGGSGGCDFQFPEGYDGEYLSFNPITNPYTVPTNKAFYILQSGGPTSGNISVDGDLVIWEPEGVVIIDENQLISSPGVNWSNFINGILIEKSNNVDYIVLNWPINITGNYTVPIGKELIILSAFSTGDLSIDNVNTSIGIANNPFLLNENQTVGISQGSGVITGYLVDENYFAGCGGGGSSSSASNATIDSLSQVVSSLDSLLNSLFGCTDATACNYNPLATYDNGLCSGFLGCTNPTAINYNPTATCDDNSCVTGNESIGDLFQGGIIFYLDGNGGGLIAAPSDQTSAKWGCHGTSILVTGFGIGTGFQNTNAILFPSWCMSQSISANFIAADICANLSLGGYSDWFLASKDELNQMYLNKAAIGGFINGDYWSSSEDDATKAWRQDFGNGSTSGVVLAPSKNATLNVRAIRAF